MPSHARCCLHAGRVPALPVVPFPFSLPASYGLRCGALLTKRMHHTASHILSLGQDIPGDLRQPRKPLEYFPFQVSSAVGLDCLIGDQVIPAIPEIVVKFPPRGVILDPDPFTLEYPQDRVCILWGNVEFKLDPRSRTPGL